MDLGRIVEVGRETEVGRSFWPARPGKKLIDWELDIATGKIPTPRVVQQVGSSQGLVPLRARDVRRLRSGFVHRVHRDFHPARCPLIVALLSRADRSSFAD